MKIIEKQIRTCVVCRDKFNQKNLLRLQCINKLLLNFTQKERSFYLCEKCILDDKKVLKTLYRQCKNKADYLHQLEEIVKIWKKK